MITAERIWKIQKLDFMIAEGRNKRAYSDCMLAVLKKKKFRVCDARRISETGLLGCRMDDLMLTVVLSNNMHYAELFGFIDAGRIHDIFAVPSDVVPETILEKEAWNVIEESKKMVNEISRLYVERKDVRQTDSILKLFDEDVQKRVQKIYDGIFECFKFEFSAFLEFTRADGSVLKKKAELASIDGERNVGFSMRPFLPDDAAIWYEFNEPMIMTFVTSGVPGNLSTAYIREDGTISEIVNRKADDHEIYENNEPVLNVIEVPEGWFEANNIHEGDRVRNVAVEANF